MPIAYTFILRCAANAHSTLDSELATSIQSLDIHAVQVNCACVSILHGFRIRFCNQYKLMRCKLRLCYRPLYTRNCFTVAVGKEFHYLSHEAKQIASIIAFTNYFS